MTNISSLSSRDKRILQTVHYYGIEMLNDNEARRYIYLENEYGLEQVNKWKRELVS